MEKFEKTPSNKTEIVHAISLDTEDFRIAMNQEAMTEAYAKKQGVELVPDEQINKLSEAIRFCLNDDLSDEDSEVQKLRGQLRYWYEKREGLIK